MDRTDAFASASRCKDCQKEIVFVQDAKTRRWVPYGAVAFGNGQYGAMEPHNGRCPVKVKRRIEEHCVGCQLDSGRTILSVWHLVGYMKCEKHDDAGKAFQHRGRTYGYDRESLLPLYREALKERKHARRRSERRGETAYLTEYCQT
ncbi:MAG: hypothetical protein JRN45_00245 [Nitrososphaerota archaeon]|nr:hypothetical protein [Nitrososphaerota archaeon]